ncbi:hypothetical protein N0V86_000001 [Didymella sp. IMI 355093]|nr:hypothetical protein N0V86_000001 [Didymella sp. IMI 355093]
MSAPNRGLWGPAGQQGSSVNHLQASSGGTATSTHIQAFNHFSDIAYGLLTRTGPNSIIPVNINVPSRSANFQQHYTVWYIMDAAPEIRRVANFFLRPRSQSPYDATFGSGIRDYSPIVARTSVHARRLLTQRQSYLKAYLIHSRGAVNLSGCTNNCAAAVRGEKLFTAFLSCVSLAGEWGGACSNCV